MNVTELEKCIETYGNDIYAFCLHLAYSQQEAEELYQDTFLKAMELLKKIEAEKLIKKWNFGAGDSDMDSTDNENSKNVAKMEG